MRSPTSPAAPWRATSGAGDITFFRLQSTADTQLKAYIAQGEIAARGHCESFGAIGAFAIPEMDRFYRHVLVAKRYPAPWRGGLRPLRQGAV